MKTSLMKSLCLLVPCLLLAGCLSARAQVLIDWGSVVSLSTDTDVQTNGIVFDAVNGLQAGITATTVNGVTFNGLTLVSGTLNDGSTGTDGIVTWYADGNAYNPGFTGGSAAYQYVINNVNDANDGSVTIGNVLHPLTIGDEYQIQAFGAYYHGGYGANLTGDPSVTFLDYSGGYSIGTFTATATTETFTYGGVNGYANGGNAGFLNDIVIENVTIPEPGTWALIGLGAGVLIWRLRRRQLT
jgi:hypothetical protein